MKETAEIPTLIKITTKKLLSFGEQIFTIRIIWDNYNHSAW